MSESTVLRPKAERALKKLLTLPPMLRPEACERLADRVDHVEIDRYWAGIGANRSEELRTKAAMGLPYQEAFTRAERIVHDVSSLDPRP